jgi:hypothetical protein
MFRLLLRLVGLLSFAGAFALAVMDGTRALAANRLLFTPVSEVLQGRLSAVERSLYTIHPMLWDPLATTVLRLPLALLLCLIGILMMLATRPSEPLIGYSDR